MGVIDQMDVENFQEAIWGIKNSLDKMGNGNASTDLGAIEGLAMKIDEGLTKVASSLDGIADALREIASNMETGE